MNIAIQEAFVVISGATAAGVLTVESNAYLFPGALAWVAMDDGSASARVKILSAMGSDRVQVRRFKDDNENAQPSYGVSDMTAFATGAHICQEAQNAPVDPAYFKRVLP